MTTKDITYGIQAELWPRDYTNVEKLLMFWRREQIPVGGHSRRWPCVLHVRLWPHAIS